MYITVHLLGSKLNFVTMGFTVFTRCIKVNEYTFRGSNYAVICIFASLLIWGQLLQERICSHRSKSFSLRVYPILKELRCKGSKQEISIVIRCKNCGRKFRSVLCTHICLLICAQFTCYVELKLCWSFSLKFFYAVAISAFLVFHFLLNMCFNMHLLYITWIIHFDAVKIMRILCFYMLWAIIYNNFCLPVTSTSNT